MRAFSVTRDWATMPLTVSEHSTQRPGAQIFDHNAWRSRSSLRVFRSRPRCRALVPQCHGMFEIELGRRDIVDGALIVAFAHGALVPRPLGSFELRSAAVNGTCARSACCLLVSSCRRISIC